MTRLTWAAPGDRRFETGVDRGVLYPVNGGGVPWSGLVAVTESPVGGETRNYYMDGIKYHSRAAPEEYAATLEAYAYPPEFARCDGTENLVSGLYAMHQRRQKFGLSYRTRVGTDLDPDKGYKIHLIYNALAEPSERPNTTLGEQPEAIVFSWRLTATPIRAPKIKPTAHFVINSLETDPVAMALIEDMLYGSHTNAPHLPSQTEIIQLLATATPEAPFVVEDLGNGLYRISGSDSDVKMIDAHHYQLINEFVIKHDDGTFTATSSGGNLPSDPADPFVVESLGNGIVKITGPDEMVQMISPTRFQLNAPTVVDNGDGSYTATSS